MTLNKFASYIFFIVMILALIVGWSRDIEPEYLLPLAAGEKHVLQQSKTVPTPPSVDEIFYDLRKEAGNSAILLRVRVVDSKVINAYITVWGQISITTGMLDFIGKDIHQVANVLGHEIGHWELGHFKPWYKHSRTSERDADIYGYYLASKAGYDKCGAGRLWKKLFYKYGNWESRTHPSILERYMYTRCDNGK